VFKWGGDGAAPLSIPNDVAIVLYAASAGRSSAEGRQAETVASAFAALCVAAKSCLGSQCAIRSMVAGWGDCAGLWNVRSQG
jgi:hypothetical protein